MERGPLRIGVIGLEHLHVFEMAQGLLDVGAAVVAHAGRDGALTELFEGWCRESQRRTIEGVVDDPSLDLVVIAAVPDERGHLAAAALHAGRHVLTAKPAVTTQAELAAVSAAAEASGRRWWVFFSERLTNPAVTEAVAMVRAGAIGDLVAVSGAAPHTLAPESRPDWFFDPARSGGVLVDLAAHQADQLLALAGPGRTEVLAATVANVACADHPAMQDLGRMSLRHTTAGGRVVLGDHHVDYLSPAGLGTWGDVRLTLTGTAGSIEVRANIDPAGAGIGAHLIVVDGDEPRRIDTSAVGIDWAERLREDVAHDTDTFMSHRHAVAACDITLRAQAMATAAVAS